MNSIPKRAYHYLSDDLTTQVGLFTSHKITILLTRVYYGGYKRSLLTLALGLRRGVGGTSNHGTIATSHRARLCVWEEG